MLRRLKENRLALDTAFVTVVAMVVVMTALNGDAVLMWMLMLQVAVVLLPVALLVVMLGAACCVCQPCSKTCA